MGLMTCWMMMLTFMKVGTAVGPDGTRSGPLAIQVTRRKSSNAKHRPPNAAHHKTGRMRRVAGRATGMGASVAAPLVSIVMIQAPLPGAAAFAAEPWLHFEVTTAFSLKLVWRTCQ